jgi:hypothetical protein
MSLQRGSAEIIMPKLYCAILATAAFASQGITQTTLPPGTAPAADAPAPEPCPPANPEIDSSGEPIYTACQIKAMQGTLPKVVNAPKVPDLKPLFKLGIQGEPLFKIVIGPDGKPRNVTLRDSSRSAELDKIAETIVQGTTFTKPMDGQGRAVSVEALYPVNLWKDTIGEPDFLKKKCSQFLVDALWFQENFPERKPESYRGWTLASGLVMMSAISGLNGPRNLPKAPQFSDIFLMCKSHPDKMFFEVLMGK